METMRALAKSPVHEIRSWKEIDSCEKLLNYVIRLEPFYTQTIISIQGC